MKAKYTFCDRVNKTEESLQFYLRCVYRFHGAEFRPSDKFSTVCTNQVCVSNARLPFRQVNGEIVSVVGTLPVEMINNRK